MTSESVSHVPAVLPRVLAPLRRVPFTAGFVVVLLVAGLGTGAVWSPAGERGWFDVVAYGLPSFADGRWWTVLTGAFFGLTPVYYVPIVLSFAIFVGFAEHRLGTRRAIIAVLAGQVAAVLAAAGVLLALRDVSPWAAVLATQRDVGPSAGAFAALTAASVTVHAPWRLRLRLVLIAYVVLAVLYGGTLSDLEHCLAVLIMVPFAGRLAEPARVHGTGRASRREWRLLAVAGLLVVAAVEVLTKFFPADGPLGPTGADDTPAIEVAILLVVMVLVMRGLSHGRRLAWWVMVVVAALAALFALLVGVLLVIAAIVDGDVSVEGAPMFVTGGVFWVAYLILLIAGRRAFRVPSRRRYRRGSAPEPDRDRVIELLRHNGGGTLSWMTTWPENRYFPITDGQGFVAYRRHAGVAIALGDPVCPEKRRESAVAEFADSCDKAGLVPCLFSATEPSALSVVGLGWRHLQVAEDTLIDLPGLEFKGKQWQPARSALNRADQEGIVFRLVTLAEQPRSVLAQVRAISEEWVGDKGLPEMGFTLGGMEEALDPHVRVGLALDADERVHGVTSWIPVYGGDDRIEGWTLDVMRRQSDGFKHVVEFLIASACQAFRDEGAQYLSLSGAPLARASGDGDVAVLDGLLDRLGALLEPYYGFRSLHAFKAKFRPRYAPMYLIYRDEADLPRIGMAIARAYLPDTRLRDLPKLARH